MDEDYKGHHIHASAWYFLDDNAWRPRLRVSWYDGSQEMSNLFTVQQTCARATEAEQTGLLFAEKWIDDGKPEHKEM